MTERLLVIEHGGYAPAGLLGDWAADRALAVHTVALHAGEPLPGRHLGLRRRGQPGLRARRL